MLSDLHICIISHKRPGNIQKTEELLGLHKGLTWYVGENEKEDYSAAGGTIVEGGKLIPSRNHALDDAFKQNKYCVMIEDDLISINHITAYCIPRPITFGLAIKEMYDVLKNTPMHLAGASPTGNAFYYDPHKPLGLKHFILGSFIMVKPTPLRFDDTLELKEDYDYTLQHISKYGGVCRLNYLLPRFRHSTNKGGAVDYRTEELEQSNIAKLKAKWGATISDNPRRKNEILLKVK